jgi:hypothetical protein
LSERLVRLSGSIPSTQPKEFDGVSASTQNQAFSALQFLCHQGVHVPQEQMQGVVRAKQAHRQPVGLSREEVRLVYSSLDGVGLLVSSLLHGAMLRLFETLSGPRTRAGSFGEFECGDPVNDACNGSRL